MEQKTIESTLVAMHSMKTSLVKIHEAIGVKPNMIVEELKKQGIEPAAPQIWSYTGCDGKPETEFSLDICIPVATKGENTPNITFTNLNKVNCLTYIHNGPWSEFGQVYENIFAQIAEVGKIPSGQFREVYLNCDFEDQSKCVTEIQIEIQ